MVSLATVAFAVGVGVGVGVANLAGVCWSALVPERRYWPPGRRDWRYYAHWSASHSLNACVIAVAYLDWNSLGLPRPLSLYVGLAVFVPAYAGAIAACLDLGVEETKGLEGDVRTDGWYRYSLNPQYVLYAIATAGVAAVANSTLATVLLGLYLAWWLALPFAEEPWLREQYGDADERYAERVPSGDADERYAERVPRFVGARTLRAIAGRLRGDDRATSSR